MKKEIKHNCPTDMYFDEKRGRCVRNGENLNEYSREDGKRGMPRSLLRIKKVS